MLLSNFNFLATAPGGVARLRELILTLAVQGKLVPQDAADEPAAVLLEKIRAEKNRLIAAGKIKRDKPLEGISEEEMPFELPQGWEWVRLGQIATQVTDGTHHTPKYLPTGVAFISVKDIDGNTVSFNDCKFISEEEHRQINARCNPEKGDLLLCRIGTLGRPTLVDTDRPFSLFVSVGLIKLPKSSNLSTYFYLVMKSPLLVGQYQEIKAGGSHTSKLNLGDIPQLRIPVPPLAEQSRIVTRVEELMRLCDALEAKGKLQAAQHAQLVSSLLATLTESETPEALAANWQRISEHFDLLLDRPEAVDALEQTILQLAVRGLLVPQNPQDEPASVLLKKIRAEKDRLIAEGKIRRDKPLAEISEDEKPFELPADWEWVRVATTFNTTSGNTFDLSMEKEQGACMYVKVGDMNLPGNELTITTSSRFIDPDKKTAQSLIPSGSIVFPKRGGAIATNKKRIVTTPIFVDLNTMAITPILVSTDYSYIWLLAIDLAALNTGTSVPQINHKDIDPLLFPLPPLPEQSRIVTQVNTLRRLCADLRERLAASQTTQAQLAAALLEAPAA